MVTVSNERCGPIRREPTGRGVRSSTRRVPAAYHASREDNLLGAPVEAPTAIAAGKPSVVGDATISLALRLLGDFELTVMSRPATVGWSGQQVLAFLAIRRGSVRREFLARSLWPDMPEQRLHAYLRSALWRLRKACPGVVEASTNEVRLAGHVAVDVWHSLSISRQLIDRSTHMQAEQLGQALHVNLHDDLLPGWLEEEWISVERPACPDRSVPGRGQLPPGAGRVPRLPAAAAG
jgi:hypothetical protein